MARHETDFQTGKEQALSLDEILALLGKAADGDAGTREDAIACYLSGGEGWREAVKQLGGAFAEGAAELKGRKAD